jgi:hypothetical protein
VSAIDLEVFFFKIVHRASPCESMIPLAAGHIIELTGGAGKGTGRHASGAGESPVARLPHPGLGNAFPAP